MYGIIDIGSNTMRLSCYRIAGKEITNVFHKKAMVGLVSYIEDGNLSSKGIQKAIETLNEFNIIVSSVGLDKVYVIATASFRNVLNTNEILHIVKEKLNMEVQVISGEEEAICDFIGASYNNSIEDGMLIDIGGGSTEMVFYEKGKMQKAISIPIGSLNMYTWHVSELMPDKLEMKEIKEVITQGLNKLNHLYNASHVIGVGGTNRSVCKLYNDLFEKSNNNIIMECSKVRELFRFFKDNPNDGMKKVLQIIPDRIHTIVPGLIILNTITKYYKSEQIKISPWGVREGYLIKRLKEDSMYWSQYPTDIV